MRRTVLPLGDRALIAECASGDEALALYAALSLSRPDGVTELVPAARTVMVGFEPATVSAASCRGWVERVAVEAGGAEASSAAALVIDVRYGGPDLAEVAALLGITEAEVVERHTSSRWRVAFCGFSPGFGYLVTDHDGLMVPRRAAPRTEVPAGSVGLAAEFSGVYPRSSPGGWQIVGRTDAQLWNPDVAEPALLVPGRTVRFRSA